MVNRRTPTTVGAKVKPVVLHGQPGVNMMWVRPWTADLGSVVEVRRTGPGWPWQRVRLVSREAECYIVEAV